MCEGIQGYEHLNCGELLAQSVNNNVTSWVNQTSIATFFDVVLTLEGYLDPLELSDFHSVKLNES